MTIQNVENMFENDMFCVFFVCAFWEGDREQTRFRASNDRPLMLRIRDYSNGSWQRSRARLTLERAAATV